MNSEMLSRREFWRDSIWISAADAAVRPAGLNPSRDRPEAEDGTAGFLKRIENPKPVVEAWWCVTGLGVFTVAVNGVEVGGEKNHSLSPFFSRVGKWSGRAESFRLRRKSNACPRFFHERLAA